MKLQVLALVATLVAVSAQADTLTAKCSLFRGGHATDTVLTATGDTETGNHTSPSTTIGDYKVAIDGFATVGAQNNSSKKRWVFQVRVYDQSSLTAEERKTSDGDMAFLGDFRGYADYSLENVIMTKNLGESPYFLALECETFPAEQ